MTDFHEILFPVEIGRGSTGGARRLTQIVSAIGGREQRNTEWKNSRRVYDVRSGIRSVSDLEEVRNFWEGRRGRLFGFRFLDPFDDRSGSHGSTPTATDQSIGTGDGTATEFQLKKTYEDSVHPYTRDIKKIVNESVLVAEDGSPLTTGWSVNNNTGIITFATAPTGLITAGFMYHVPVRFDIDALIVSRAAFTSGQLPNIPLVEILV